MEVGSLPKPSPGRFRILALDVDGTLLDRDSILRPSTAAAVGRAARAGIRPVLCTGRRYRRARPIALELGLDAPVVCNSGALVKEPFAHQTLWRAAFEPQGLSAILDLFRRHGEPAVSFTDRRPEDADFLVTAHPSGRELLDEYVALNREHAEVDPDWMDRPGVDAHFHLCAIGTRTRMLEFEQAALKELPGQVRTFVQKSPHYTGTMCELLHPAASKWSAVLHLAEKWGIGPHEICAIGDDMNDVPMLVGAGLGVAMGQAPAAVREVADHVTADHNSDGVAAFIEEVLLTG
jgi:Cof subfamily protein (haloacid dehalogenase superfamily)